MKKNVQLVACMATALVLSAAGAAAEVINRTWTFEAGEFGSADWSLTGDAYWDDSGAAADRLTLNEGAGNGAGSAWLNVSVVDAAQSWSVSMRGQMADFVNGGADATRVGFQSAGVAQEGFTTATDYMFIQLDSYQTTGDTYVNSMQLWTSGGGRDAVQYDLGTALEAEDYFNLSISYNALTHTASATFDSDAYAPVNGSWTVNLDNEFSGGVWYGFVGFTGGSSESHEVMSTSVNAVVPEPASAVLIAGVALLGLVGVRRFRRV